MEKKNYYFTKSQHYAGDNKELQQVPTGWIDKKIAGIGLTTLAIEQPIDTIIFSPTKTLIENKVQQYPNKRCKFTLIGVNGDIEMTAEELELAVISQKFNQGYIKIICTIDSYPKVAKYLHQCKIVVDESQLLLKWMHLKATQDGTADVYTRFLNDISIYKDNVSFISATPPNRKYFHDNHQWIEELPFIEFQFEDTVKVKPFLMKRTSPVKAVLNEIIYPLLENGSVDIWENPNKQTGTKINIEGAIIYLNSVMEIAFVLNQIKDKNASEIGYIIGNSAKNDIEIASVQRKSLPAQKYRVTDFKHLPKIVFITSTGFQGIDLYSEKHIQIIVGKADKKHCRYDLDTVKQMISRVRNTSNIHYGTYMYYYSQNEMQLTEDVINEMIDGLYECADDDCSNINDATPEKKQHRKETIFSGSRAKEYIYEENGTFIVNTTLLEYERDGMKELSKIYTTGFDMRNATIYTETPIDFKKPYNRECSTNNNSYISYLNAFKEWIQTGTEPDESLTSSPTYQEIKEVYQTTGKIYERQDYFVSAINKINAEMMLENVKTQIQNSFKLYSLYDCAEIKTTLQGIYDANGINRKAKTGDLIEFFEADKERKGTKQYYRLNKRK